jgi:hypothetical protein
MDSTYKQPIVNWEETQREKQMREDIEYLVKELAFLYDEDNEVHTMTMVIADL